MVNNRAIEKYDVPVVLCIIQQHPSEELDEEDVKRSLALLNDEYNCSAQRLRVKICSPEIGEDHMVRKLDII